MPDLTAVLLRLADPPLAPPDSVDALRQRVRRRQRRRWATRTSVAVACILALGLPVLRVLTSGSTDGSVGIATSPALDVPEAVAPTPEHPAGRFLPTWLPVTLRILTEIESPYSSGADGLFRTYARGGSQPFDHDTLTISLQDGAPEFDVATAVSRYPGAVRRDVQGRPGLFLPTVSGRSTTTLMWSPAPGRVAQVIGLGLTELELATVADGFQLPPRLDATPLPTGFTEFQRNDIDAFPPAVPLQFTAGTDPSRGGARPPDAPSVRIVAAWDAAAPPGEPAPPVRGRPTTRFEAGAETTLSWFERPGLFVSVVGTNLDDNDLRRIATGLREQSHKEVLARPTGGLVVLARGEVGGAAYELRTRGGVSGPCLELAHGWLASRCSSDPSAALADFGVSISQGVAFGSVISEANRVRLELPGGQSVEAATVGNESAQGASFFVVEVPPDVTRVEAVVAFGADGQTLRRTPGS